MKRYAKYKDSGLKWIGDIPEGWGLSKLKYSTKLNMGQSPNSENFTELEGFPFLQGNAEFGKIHPQHKLNTLQITKLSNVGDILLSIRGSVGEINWSNIEYCIGRGLCSITPIDIIPNYLWFFILTSKDEFKSKSDGSTFLAINGNDLRNHHIPLPPLKEQEQIVAYLDEKTSHIDKILDISKKKIGLMKEQRASIINQVVTKGLNPNAKMKHSGVEWIGDIPEGWGVNKVGNNTYVKGRIGWKGLKSEDFLDEGPYLVTGTDFNKDGTINWANIYHVSNERYDEDPFIQLKDNDVLITKDGTIGKVVYVGNLLGKTCLNSGIFLTRPTNGQYISRYFFWVLNSNVFKVFVYFNSNGATIQHLYQNVFINFKFPIPPLEEQEKIVAYLDEKTSIIDKSISIEERRIGLLKEYRQSIISQVITGKIKVIADE